MTWKKIIELIAEILLLIAKGMSRQEAINITAPKYGIMPNLLEQILK